MSATHSVRRTGLFALHQLTVLAGILLFPFVLAGRRVGLSLPVGRAVERVRRAYDDVSPDTDEAETEG